MVKIFWLAAVLLFSWPLLGQEAEIPDPRNWAAELPDSIWLETPGIVRTFTIVPSNKKSAEKWAKTTEKMVGMGFLQFIPLDASAFGAQLNDFETKAVPEGEAAAETPISAESSQAQLILLEQKNRFHAQVRRKGALKTIAKWGFKKADVAGPESFYRYLSKKMAYDAVVLDVKNDLILAGFIAKKTELGQGLLIKGSAKRQVLVPSKIKGDALLQILRIEGEFAVLEILLSQSKAKILPGTKILLGQSEQLKGLMSGAPSSSKSKNKKKEGEAAAKSAKPAKAETAPEAKAEAEAEAETPPPAAEEEEAAE